MLKYFDIISICKFPPKTFGKTGTKTIVLFLRRKKFPPETCDFIQERIDTWFGGNYENDIIYKDNDIIKQFCSFREIDYNDFISNPQKYESEKEKIYFYYLVTLQRNPVVIMNAENFDSDKTKNFLGYDWTERNKSHHIKYLHQKNNNSEDKIVSSKEGINKIKTALFNPNNDNDMSKINAIIRANYNDEEIEVPEELTNIVSVKNLVNLLDFDASNFMKIISNKLNSKIEINSKYPLKSLGEIFKTLETGTRPGDGSEKVNSGIYSLGGTHIDNISGFITLDKPYYIPNYFFSSADRGKIKKHDILICKDGAKSGKIALVRDELDNKKAMINEHVYLARSENSITQMYVFRFLHSELGNKLLVSAKTGAAIEGINSSNLKRIEIPFPPIDIQQKIVDEIEQIEKGTYTQVQLVEIPKMKQEVLDKYLK